LLGGTAGLIIAMLISFGRLAVNTAMTTLGTIITVINTVLPKKIPLDEDKRTTIAKVSGVLGYPLGSIIGFIGAIFIGVGRIFTNNCKSFARSFTQVIRLALHAQDQDQVSVPELKGRHFVWKVIGTPGYLLGGIFGFVGAIFVGVGRVFTNSCKSFARSFAQVIRLALHAKDQDEVSVPELKDRNLIGKVIGTAGYLLGGIFGFVGAVFIGIGRVFTNSCKSFARSFTQVIRLALHEKDQDNISVPALKDRNSVGKIMGSPGYLLGGIVGFVGAVFIGVGRVLTNSCKSFARSFTQVINLALHTNDQVSVPELEGRNLAGKIKGAPGYLLGGIFGFIGMIFIAAGRVLTNSCKSFAGSFTEVINLVLHAKDQVAVPEFKHRNFAAKIMGSPGYLLGGIFGFVGAVFVCVGRVLTNSYKSFARSFAQVIRLALHAKDQEQVLVPEFKDQNLAGKIMGTPGYLLGGVFGFASAIFIGAGRILTNSCKSFAYSFIQSINLALHKNNKLPVQELADRNLLGKILGAPGYLLGGVVGFIGAMFIGLGRVLNQSQLSFRALSGSLINGAVKRRWCADTLGNDNRTSANKDAGLLGYIAATIITAPVAAVIFFVNKVLPILFAGIMGFVAFFIIAPCKFIARWCSSTKKDSYEKESKSTEKLNVSEAKVSAVIEQKFKNIHSSLDGFGSLTPNTSIVENGDGQESWGSFFRRSFTFNAKSTTERILNKLWEHYQKFKTTNNNPKEPFFDVNKAEFQNAITEVTDYYQNDVFASKEDIKESITEIEESAQFLCNYIAGNQKPEIPKNLYSKKEITWGAVFWGAPPSSSVGETSLNSIKGEQVTVKNP
jgi:hypothetical protein